MASLRLQRVRELLKREIGEAIRREFEVSQVGLITVNDVDVAGDLHTALVFISILGSPEQQKRGFSQLARRRNRIQAIVARTRAGNSGCFTNTPRNWSACISQMAFVDKMVLPLKTPSLKIIERKFA